MTCTHEVLIETWPPICACCGTVLCPDCPVNDRQPLQSRLPDLVRCRRCAEKEGDRHAFYVVIDRDLLDAKVGRKLAAEIIESCSSDAMVMG